MASKFRVHPAIGVSRIGNAPDEFFIGPEQPGIPGNWGNGQFNSFRDAAGRVKRQAARFRVFEYPEAGAAPREITAGNGGIVDIEWRVHLANNKGSFFTFNGQSGASDAYLARSNKSADGQEKFDPNRSNLRNAGVSEADRKRLLEIDPGERVISKNKPAPVVLTNPNQSVPFIKDLGELRLDEAGRLLVLGGHGTSGSSEDPPRPIDEYANNDTWFDDVSDGSVKARLLFANGSSVDAEAAWVLVAPPKFAPGICNAVSLYDTLWDIAVRELDIPVGNSLFTVPPFSGVAAQKQLWNANVGRSLDGYKPSFAREIYPLLARAVAARDVHDPGEINRGYHLELVNWGLLSQPDSGQEGDKGRALRQLLFKWVRNPRSTEVYWEGMPRGLGDDYTALDDYENQKAQQPLPTSFLSLTQVQYALLEQWAKGAFVSDWLGDEPGIPAAVEITPAGLDIAALENCVGGPFYPGIEVSWLIRRPELYVEPFRLRVPGVPEGEQQESQALKVGAVEFRPGFFTQQMAQPWQADFYDCHKERHEAPDGKAYFYMWWTAQRPDDVYPAGATEQNRWVRQFDTVKTKDDPDDLENLARFEQMQQNWSKLRFIIRAPQGTNHDLEEEA